MKNKWQFFLVFMFFILANGFGQQNFGNYNDVPEWLRILELYSIIGESAPQGSIVPLTFDIVKLIESNDLFKGLEYYLSSDLTLTNMTGRAVRGGLVIDNGRTVRFPAANSGEFVGFDSKTYSDAILTVKFPGIVQHFIRDPKTNKFYFYAADINPALVEGPVPYLCIRQIGAPFRNSSAGRQPSLPAPQAAWQSSAARIPSAVDPIPVYIMGSGRLRKDAIVSYIVNKGSTMNRQRIDELVYTYIREAVEEGVNHDIAIAQMCYATGFLNNQRLIATHNYAGLNTDMGISVRGGSSHFNPTEGARAHIQHLKGYASTAWPQKELVDRRYDLLGAMRGTVKTLDDLFVAWSPYNAQNYGYEIRKIMREMYQFSERF